MKTTPQRRKSSKATPPASPETAFEAGPVAEEPAAPQVDAEQREVLVRLAAYAFYERRGMVGGHELEDWLRAEMEVDRQLAAGKPPSPLS